MQAHKPESRCQFHETLEASDNIASFLSSNPGDVTYCTSKEPALYADFEGVLVVGHDKVFLSPTDPFSLVSDA